jgi:cytochrome P450
MCKPTPHYGIPQYLRARGQLEEALRSGDLSEKERESTDSLMYLAGSHTTSLTRRFIASLLQEHSEWKIAIESEWLSYLENLGEDPTYENLLVFLSKSKTLAAVVTESLRLYPVVPSIVRVAKERFTLGDTTIHPGDLLVLNIMGYQRNARVWDKPTEFNPERFMTEEHHPALLTFGYGAGRCIGQHLAVQALRLWTLYAVTHEDKALANLPSGKTTYTVEAPFLEPTVST